MVDTQKLLRRKQVESQTGLSRTTIYENMTQGTFPRPIKIGERSVAWLESEINDWINNRIKTTRGEL
jgi:prophage regulatory protein